MWKTFRIKPEELGFLYQRDSFKKILNPGNYTYFGRHWSLKTYNLNQPQAQIEDLSLLLQTSGTALAPYLTVVMTEFNEAALVRVGQDWLSIAPDEQRCFWKGFIPVEVQKFDLGASFRVPNELALRLRGVNLRGIEKYTIANNQLGLLYIENNFAGTLEPGEHAFFNFSRKIVVTVFDRNDPRPAFGDPDVLMEQQPEFVSTYCTPVEVGAMEIALIRDRGKLVAILPPGQRQLFWQGVGVEKIDLMNAAKLSPALIEELIHGLPLARKLIDSIVYIAYVADSHVGLLYINEELQGTLPPGVHAWWLYGRMIKAESLDLRLQILDVSGQDILSKDKVPLRLNLTAGWRILDPVRTKTACSNIQDFIYQELQFALRSAVGERTLDGILEDKGAIDQQIANYIREKVADYGVEILSVGVKDIILPGEIKAILSKVVEAEKSAQANVVRRREETAATRSMLNTARVMEDNPVALRLKELEVLERIAEKIDHIQVGSLNGVLQDLIRIDRS